MKVFMDPKEVKTFKGLFPRGRWECIWIDLLGLPGLICEDGVDEVEIDLVRFPFSEFPVERGLYDPKEVQKREFMKCLVGWRGIEDEKSGEPVQCSDEAKTHLFNYDQRLRNFVMRSLYEMDGSRDEALKN